MPRTYKSTGKSNIYRKANTLYFRMTVPKDIVEVFGQSEVYRSLKTSDLRTAEEKASVMRTALRREFTQLRANNSTVKEALKIKRELEEAKKREEEVLESWRRMHPWEEPTLNQLEDLGIGLFDDAVSTYIDKLREQGKDKEAELILDIAESKRVPTNCFVSEFVESTNLKDRTRKERIKHLEELSNRFPVLPIEPKDVKKYVLELQQGGLSAKTINKRLSNWRVYYQYLLDLGHLDENKGNPFDKQNVKEKSKGKGPKRSVFEISDIKKLEVAARGKRGDKNLHSLILLGAYTGARREELGRLRVENVKDKDGISYLEITDAKTAAGVRDVPIHPDIKPLVEDLIATTSDGFLLSNEPVRNNGERTDALGKRFGNLKSKLGFGTKHVFHSFRNTVITQLGNAGVPQYLINDIIGHEQTTMAFGVYAGDLSLTKRLDAVKTIKYDGLNTTPKGDK